MLPPLIVFAWHARKVSAHALLGGAPSLRRPRHSLARGQASKPCAEEGERAFEHDGPALVEVMCDPDLI
jgi:hypothetical protein